MFNHLDSTSSSSSSSSLRPAPARQWLMQNRQFQFRANSRPSIFLVSYCDIVERWRIVYLRGPSAIGEDRARRKCVRWTCGDKRQRSNPTVRPVFLASPVRHATPRSGCVWPLSLPFFIRRRGCPLSWGWDGNQVRSVAHSNCSFSRPPSFHRGRPTPPKKKRRKIWSKPRPLGKWNVKRIFSFFLFLSSSWHKLCEGSRFCRWRTYF